MSAFLRLRCTTAERIPQETPMIDMLRWISIHRFESIDLIDLIDIHRFEFALKMRNTSNSFCMQHREKYQHTRLLQASRLLYVVDLLLHVVDLPCDIRLHEHLLKLHLLRHHPVDALILIAYSMTKTKQMNTKNHRQQAANISRT